MFVPSINNQNNYILAVDDNPDNLFLIKLALEQQGYNVKLVEDGRSALAQIERDPPDLILLDIMMPGMNGYEVTEKIRANESLPFIPIVLITAHQESSLTKGLDIGADEFIRKPVEIDELQARVRALLRLKSTIDRQENYISCLTHDLRTPLVAANRMLHLLGQGIFGEVTHETSKTIETIIGSNDNLLQMLNNLLEVHCYEVGEKTLSFTDFDLKQSLEEVASRLISLAEEKNLDLKLDLAEVPEIKGDRLELQRVWTNLIGNAIKFTDKGYVKVSLALSEDSRSVVIEFEDSGIGIPPENLATIFDRFRKGNHRRSGNGLGLHLCYQIVRAHRGEIAVSSKLGEGTCFQVTLPLQRE